MTWLSEHLARCRAEVAARKTSSLEAELRERLAESETPRPFLAGLKSSQVPVVIAEIKFRSPSKGMLRAESDVERVAEGYHRGGAAALSVLVDAAHFGGELAFLGRARQACPLPLLAKGFFVDPLELLEVRAAGADAALLIAKALTQSELAAMLEMARSLGLATLTELHDDEDLAKVQGLPFDLVGVNHRNLETLRMAPERSAALAPRLPVARGCVAESGLRTGEDLWRMAALGYDAVLIGTHFMSRPDPGAELAKLLEDCRDGR